MTGHDTFYLLLDAAAILATVLMLMMTEKPMVDRTPDESIEHHIYGMLDNQQENGDEDLMTWSVDDIVADLLAYADLDEEETEDVIRAHVITWKLKRSITT